MPNTFVSYASEDHELVKALVSGVERDGHRCWHYDRDSLPSEVYLAEISKAIEACDLFILLATKASLDSYQVTKEIEQAHQRRKRIFPILYQVTGDDVRAMRPAWAAALGATTYVELREGGLKNIIEDVIRVCKTFAKSSPMVAMSWAADAWHIDISLLDRIVVQTPTIKDFIQGSHQYFISANKGVGKTLLLKFKRSQLMAEHTRGAHHSRSEVVFIPEGRPYLDFMGGELPSLKKSHIDFLSALRNCRRLWSFALRASILSHFPEQFSALNADRFIEAGRIPIHELIPDRAAATAVFRGLISLPINDVNRLLDKMDANLEYAFRNIHSAAYTFIDRVEQGVSNLPQEAWIHIQAGLIEAAWDVMNSNNHVKVYATIREEAYANYGSDSKNNLYSATLTLRYSLAELREMIDSLSNLYETTPTFDLFVGITSVENVYCRLKEDSFLYLYRHTVGRPRDLVIICSQLSRARRHLDERRFREVVNEAGAVNIVTNVFHEMGVFLSCLHDSADRNRFFSFLPYNILTRDELEAICCEFNNLSAMNYSDLQNCSDAISHPFCELYHCGLIGTVQDDPAQGDVQQHFKQPHDIMTCRESCLPKADYYLLHPALQSLIHQHRSGAGYHTFRYVAVGHKYPWKGHHGELVDLQRSLLNVNDPDIRHEVLLFVESTLSDSSGEATFDPVNQPSFDGLQTRLERLGHEDVYLLLDRYVMAIKVRSGWR